MASRCRCDALTNWAMKAQTRADRLRVRMFPWWINQWTYKMNHTLNCGYEIKWSYDPRTYQRNFSNCVEKSEQSWASMGFESVILRRVIKDYLRVQIARICRLVSICKNLPARSVYAQMERLSSAEVTSHVRLIKWPCFHIPWWSNRTRDRKGIGSDFFRVSPSHRCIQKNNSLQGWGDYHSVLKCFLLCSVM